MIAAFNRVFDANGCHDVSPFGRFVGKANVFASLPVGGMGCSNGTEKEWRSIFPPWFPLVSLLLDVSIQWSNPVSGQSLF